MAKPYNDQKYGLGEPVASMLKDFCAAHYNAPAKDVIREAVKNFILQEIEDPKTKERYDQARKKRLGLETKIISLATKK